MKAVEEEFHLKLGEDHCKAIPVRVDAGMAA
jgi:hypothetical protein